MPHGLVCLCTATYVTHPILAAVDAKKCYATGRGIQPKGVRIGEDADFCVYTKGAGEGELVIKVVGPGGVEERLRIRKVPIDIHR